MCQSVEAERCETGATRNERAQRVRAAAAGGGAGATYASVSASAYACAPHSTWKVSAVRTQALRH